MAAGWLVDRPPLPSQEVLALGPRIVPVRFVRNLRARRYILRLGPEGAARVTVPRRGTLTEARAFLGRHRDWLETQLQRRSAAADRDRAWRLGSEILYRGEPARLEIDAGGRVRFGDQALRAADPAGDLRPALERHLRRLAARELTARVAELAAACGATVGRVSVRNQRSRWGSCSRRGTISLNWRLIQTPPFVRDYLIWHELAHLKHMNHSHRFWAEVARLCPAYPEAERWLKCHDDLLRA